MANIVFNQALGQAVAWYRNVDENTPSTATLVVALLATSGLETDAVLKDMDNFSLLVAGATNEATNTGYARKVLTDTDLTYVVDDTNDRVDLDCADQTWVTLANDGTGAISALVFCYDATSSGVTATAMIPMTKHDFVVTPDGSNVTAQISSTGFFRAS